MRFDEYETKLRLEKQAQLRRYMKKRDGRILWGMVGVFFFFIFLIVVRGT